MKISQNLEHQQRKRFLIGAFTPEKLTTFRTKARFLPKNNAKWLLHLLFIVGKCRKSRITTRIDPFGMTLPLFFEFVLDYFRSTEGFEVQRSHDVHYVTMKEGVVSNLERSIKKIRSSSTH